MCVIKQGNKLMIVGKHMGEEGKGSTLIMTQITSIKTKKYIFWLE